MRASVSGVVAVDVDRTTVLADRDACVFGSILVETSLFGCLEATSSFTAGRKHLLLEDFAGAMLFARNVGGNVPVRQIRIDFVPLLVGIVDELAVDSDLRRQSLVDIDRLERPIRTLDIRGEDDAVVAELDFLDFRHACFRAGCDFLFTDFARCIGDVDRGFTDALAELFQASGRTTGLDNRRLEVREGLAEILGNDLRIGENGRRTGDLYLIAGRGRADRTGKGDRGRRSGEKEFFHWRQLPVRNSVRRPAGVGERNNNSV